MGEPEKEAIGQEGRKARGRMGEGGRGVSRGDARGRDI